MKNSYARLLIENDGKLRWIKFNFPPRKNAWDISLIRDISEALRDAAEDDSVAVVALTGVGDFYTSGNDLKATSPNITEEHIRKNYEDFLQMVNSFINFPKLLIAAINGPCIGVGATTAALCDVIYCTDTTYFLTPFSKLGISPEGCSTYTFPRILGSSKAAEVLLLSYKLSAEEALKYNFVSEIFNKNIFHAEVTKRLKEFTELPQHSILAGKKLIRKFSTEILEKVNAAEVEVLINIILSRFRSNITSKL